MSKKGKEELRDICSEDLFSLLDEQTKRMIARDLEDIYGEKNVLVNPEEPWVFQLDK